MTKARDLSNIISGGFTDADIPNDILKKLDIIGYDLEDYSHDTVKMFYEDALAAGYKI